MGEFQDKEHVVFIAKDNGEPDERLGQELTHHSHEDTVVGHGHPVLGTIKLHLRAQRIG